MVRTYVRVYVRTGERAYVMRTHNFFYVINVEIFFFCLVCCFLLFVIGGFLSWIFQSLHTFSCFYYHIFIFYSSYPLHISTIPVSYRPVAEYNAVLWQS